MQILYDPSKGYAKWLFNGAAHRLKFKTLSGFVNSICGKWRNHRKKQQRKQDGTKIM